MAWSILDGFCELIRERCEVIAQSGELIRKFAILRGGGGEKKMYTTCGLNWVNASEPVRGFRPVLLRWADTPNGRYEVFQSADGFDAWYTPWTRGALIFLGTNRTATGARQRCETREARKKPAGS